MCAHIPSQLGLFWKEICQLYGQECYIPASNESKENLALQFAPLSLRGVRNKLSKMLSNEGKDKWGEAVFVLDVLLSLRALERVATQWDTIR